jgi:hypothetical protein
MPFIENLRSKGDSEDSVGGKFNPFRILEIGESMVRYCDGIRIKNYNFLAILTSDRLVLIESAQQSTGTIAKEIPVTLIQGAEMERDEKNRPTLAVSMEVGGQTRIMKLIFTGLIAEPETECREWFAAINGYPPEPVPESTPGPMSVQVPQSEPAEPVASTVQSPIIDAEEAIPPSSSPKAEVVREKVRDDSDVQRAAKTAKQISEPIPDAIPQREAGVVPSPGIMAEKMPVVSSPVTPEMVVSQKAVLDKSISEKPCKETGKGVLSKTIAPSGLGSIVISLEKPRYWSGSPVTEKNQSPEFEWCKRLGIAYIAAHRS